MSTENAPREGRKRGGWTPVYREVWTHYLPLIGKDALVYYLYLLDHRQNNENDPRYGKAWPGRNKVAEDLSISKKSLQRIDELLTGVGLVEIERVPTGAGRPRIQYIVHDPLTAAEFDAKVAEGTFEGFDGNFESSDGNMINTYLSIRNDKDLLNTNAPKEISAYNSRDIIKYWCEKYKEIYQEEYLPVYKREGAQVKNQLLATYGAEKLIKIIDVVFAFYDHKWSGPDYPRPTIGQLASWLANKAAAFVTDDAPPAVHSEQESPALDYEAYLKREGIA